MPFDWHRPQRNWGPRIREVDYLGMRLIILENETLRIGVLAGKGTDVIEFNYKPRDLDFTWLTWTGVRNPTSFLSTSPDLYATFNDTYLGGWQEIFPNGGEPAKYAGAQFGQHGEVCNLPWDVRIVEDSEETVAVTFTVRTFKSPYRIDKTLRLVAGDASLHLSETIENESNVPLQAMWGQHFTFGQPFMEEGCIVRLPDGVTVIPHPDVIDPSGRRIKADRRTQWPQADDIVGGSLDLSIIPPRGTMSELVYLTGFPETWYEVVHPGKGIGCRVEWDKSIMPYLWFWQEYGASLDAPWYGRSYNIGLEPFSSYPTNGLMEAIENGSALTFAPREIKHFALRASIFETGKGK